MFDEILLNKIRNAKKVAVITGAGVSAESGIPTFRGAGGYWRNYKAEELATPQAFAKNPSLVWEWYNMRREVCYNAKPNPAHNVIVKMESYYPEFFLITQNVDGLHKRAGNKKLVQIHGDIFTVRCTSCEYIGENWDVPLKEIPPKCSTCGSLLRPHIVWFGETYFPGVLEACYEYLSDCDLLFIIGTSGAVATPVYLAGYGIQNGAFSVEVNLDKTSLSSIVNYSFQEKAGEFLPKLWESVFL